ncbi:hypothetical protein J1N35_041792 [Gossypium stocksii]|uniref:Uncharacterized protein n=1 Tax=Gossypium stocksii TaxID=47602 RepID=A0A9D3ZK06_9ROSI|nr:hypothetical protein J1N35_041792 [Gossypium stocksii]
MLNEDYRWLEGPFLFNTDGTSMFSGIMEAAMRGKDLILCMILMVIENVPMDECVELDSIEVETEVPDIIVEQQDLNFSCQRGIEDGELSKVLRLLRKFPTLVREIDKNALETTKMVSIPSHVCPVVEAPILIPIVLEFYSNLEIARQAWVYAKHANVDICAFAICYYYGILFYEEDDLLSLDLNRLLM